MSKEAEKTQDIRSTEQVLEIPLSQIHPFEGHPFKVQDDALMQETIDSIIQFGVLNPVIVRPDEKGGYEMISGHRRLHASELAGRNTIPAICRNMTDDEAIILMVDSNLQRESLLPSERAWAYRLKLDALKHQGKRLDLTSDQNGQKLNGMTVREKIAKDDGKSPTQVQRYIRLTELIPELMDMVDRKEIAMNPAVELSYLKKDEQQVFLEALNYAQAAPSLSQAQRIRKPSQDGSCTQDAMFKIMSEDKKDELDHITIRNDVLRRYFPKSYTPRQMQNTIIKLLEQWQRRQQRDHVR